MSKPGLINLNDQYDDPEPPQGGTDSGGQGGGNGTPDPEEEEEEEEEESGTEHDQDPNDDDNDGDGPSPLQQLLTKEFEFVNGLINFNGKDVAFDRMKPAEQAEFLQELIADREENALKNGLTDKELLVINTMRNPNANRQAAADLILGAPTVSAVSKLSDDDVNLRDIKKRLPNLTEEEQRAELDDRKQRRHYAEETKSLRQELTQQATAEATREEQKRQDEQYQTVVTTIAKMPDIDGAPLDDELRDFLIGGISDVNPTTGATELDSLLEDPANRIKALYWLKFGAQVQGHYTSEVTRLVDEGVRQRLGKGPTERNSRGHGGRGNKGRTDPNVADFRLGDDPRATS